MQWQTQQLQSVVAIHLWRVDLPQKKVYFYAKMTCQFIYYTPASSLEQKEILIRNKNPFYFCFKPTYFLLHVNRYFNKMYEILQTNFKILIVYVDIQHP